MGKGNRRHVSRETKEEIARLSLDPTLKVREIAEAAGVSHQTVNRTLNKWRSKGREVREYHGYGRPAALRQAELEYLEQRHREEPTVELQVLQQELRDKFNIEVHLTTISRHRYKMGLVQPDPGRLRIQEEKEEQRRAGALQKLAERKLTFAEVDKEKRHAFLSRVRGYNPQTLVFVDEITFSDVYIPLKLCEEGPAATIRDWTHSHRHRQTVFLALTTDGLLDFSAVSSAPPCPSDRSAFLTRTVAHLRPFPSPHSVLITRSSALYDTNSLKEAVEARGAKLLHYARYAFDLNPLTSAAKLVHDWAYRQRQGSRWRLRQPGMLTSVDGENAPIDSLFDELCQITPEAAQSWLKDIGYRV